MVRISPLAVFAPLHSDLSVTPGYLTQLEFKVLFDPNSTRLTYSLKISSSSYHYLCLTCGNKGPIFKSFPSEKPGKGTSLTALDLISAMG